MLFIVAYVLCCSFAFGQPVAKFSATPVSGCAPLTVTFQDASTGSPVSWQWNLGNGSTSNQQNPTTTYFNSGTYTISLKVSDGAGSDSITKIQYITVFDKPIVDFTASNLSGCFPFTVNFSDLSTAGSGNVAAWSWDFGDGDTSALQNPSHKYITGGNYSITLKATNSDGCTKILSKIQYIKVNGGVTPSFTNSSAIHCKAPELITFNNLSTGPGVLSYQWDFGDGNTSTLKNPTNNYLSGGTFPVQLIVKSSLGCVDTFSNSSGVLIRNFQTTFSGPDSICNSLAAAFTNTSIPADTLSLWSFGDGTTSTLNAPSKTWSTTGSYQVKLINDFGVCKDSLTKIVKVVVPPVVNFNVTDTFNCKAPFTTQFNDLTPGSVSWQWNFGDGTTSTLKNPTHTYTASGQFTVTLIAQNASGCSNVLTKNQLIHIYNPPISVTGLPGGGCLPFVFNPIPVINDPKGIATYSWDFGNGSTSTLANPSTTYNTLGTFDVKLYITTNDGCNDTLISTGGVKTGTLPTADFSAAPVVQCVGKNISFTDMSPLPVDTWLWDFGDGGTSTQQNPSYAYQKNGTFNVKLTVTNNGCSASVTKSNYIKALPPVAKFTPTFNCANRLQVSFADNSVLPQTWSWDFGDGNTSNSQNPAYTYSALGNYNVTLTVTNAGCTNSKTIPIKLIQEKPDFIFTTKDSICKNSSVGSTATNVTVANITNFTWYYGDNTSTGGSGITGLHKYTTTGTYSYKLITTDIHGCKDSVTKPNIVYVHGPTASFSAAPLAGCKGLAVNFTDGSFSDGINPIKNWQWSYGDGLIQTQISPPFSHTYNTTGNFIPQLRVTDASGCADSIGLSTSILVTQPKVNFFSADSFACNGGNVAFTNTSTAVNPVYAWSLGNGIFSNQQNPVTSYITDTSYSVKLVITDVNGCKDSLQKNNYIRVITEKAAFTINDSISSCAPFEVDFTNNSLNNTSQKWDFGDGSNSTSKNPTHYYFAPGIYTATLYAIGQGGCTDSFKRTIRLYSSTATLTYVPIAGCSNTRVNFHISTSGPVQYLWDFGDGNTLSTTDSNVVNDYVQAGTFLPKVIMTDPVGCKIPVTGTDTIRLTKSNINFATSDSFVCIGSPIIFYDSTTANAPISSYHWKFGDGSVSSQQKPTHSYSAAGTYAVSLVVTTINGCSDSLTKNNLIKVYGPTANFSASSLSACKDVTNIIFTDNSSTDGIHPITSWQWNFGDGIIQNTNAAPVTHMYDSTGSFIPELKITDSYGCADSFTLNKPVVVPLIKAAFSASDTTACAGSNIIFSNNSAGNNLTYAWTLGNGITSSQPSPSTTYNIDGSYTVKLVITDNNGCTDSLQKNQYINIQSVKASFTISDSTTICPPLNVQFTNTSVNYKSLSWNFGDGSTSAAAAPLHSYNVPGTFVATLIATGSGGCIDSFKRTIRVFSPAAILTYVPLSGCSQVTVNFHIAASGPTNYFWDFNDGDTITSSLNNIIHTYASQGAYIPKVIMKDISGCQIPVIGTDTIHVYKLTANFSAADSTVCMANNTISFTDRSTSNSSISSWHWDFGDGNTSSTQNPSHKYTSPGAYTVQLIIVTIDGCTDTITKNNFVHINGSTAKFGVSALSGCGPLNIIFTDSSLTDGIHPITNWQWNYGDGTIQNTSSAPANHTYTAAGNFIAGLKITDTYGCTDSFTLGNTINVSLPIAGFNSLDTIACIGKNIAFTNTSSGNNLTYAWTLGNGLTSTLASPVISYNSDGNYTVKLVIKDINGCSDSVQKNNYIKVLTAKASFDISDSTAICLPFVVHFTNTSVNYVNLHWSFGDGNTSTAADPIHSYNMPGSYIATLFATDAGGCIDSFKRNIKVFSPNASLTYVPLSGCTQITVNFHLTTNKPLSYFWDFDDGDTTTSLLADMVHTYIIPGTYVPKVIMKDVTGCQIPVIGTDTVHVYKLTAKFSSPVQTICLGTNIKFTDLSTSNSPINSWHWDFGDGNSSSSQNPAHKYAGPGIYSVRLIIITTDGCSDTLIKNNFITVSSIPNVDISGNTTSCLPADLTFTGILVQPDTASIAWKWNFGNGNTSNSQNPVAQKYNTAGSFPIQLIASNFAGCADTINKTITIHPMPATDAGVNTTVCLNKSLSLQATGADSYIWSPSAYLSCTACANPVTTPADNIVYYVKGSTIYGCETTDSVLIKVQKPFKLTVTPKSDSICIGQSTQLNASGADKYTWSPAAGLNNASAGNPVASPSATTSYKLIAHDNLNCFADSATVKISVFPYPAVEAGADKRIPFGQSITLAPVYSSDVSSYLWNPATGLSCIDCPNPVATPQSSTVYSITVTNKGGCSAVDSFTILLPCQSSVFIPNTFSPNNDGVNDVFYPRGKDVYLIQSLRVFDRWGEIVFQRTSFAPNDPLQGWDGRFSGKQASADVYTYVIEIICNNGEISAFKGNVTLIR